MRPVSRWRHLMSSRVSVAARSGVDGYGKPSYGAAATYAAHVRGERTLVRNASGQEVVSSQTVYLATAASVLPSAQVTLSTSDVGSTEGWALHPPILAVERRSDQNAPHHVVLRLQ